MSLRDRLGRVLTRSAVQVAPTPALTAPSIARAKPLLFLHIGTSKTGTTAIQTFCWENRQRLADCGVIYPERGAVAGAHHQLSPYIPPSLANAWPYEPVESWAPALAALADRPVVLSSELISNADPALIKRIAKALEPHFDTRIVVYLRRIDDHVMAAYNQQVKVGHQAYPLEDIADVLFRQLRSDRMLLPWAKAFGMDHLKVRPYERVQFAGGDLLQDFCATIGVGWRDDFELPKAEANARLSPDALEYKRCLNNLIPDMAVSADFIAPLLDYSAQAHSGSSRAFQAVALLPAGVRQAMIAKLAPFYSRLAREALGRSDGRLFLADPPKDDKTWQPVTLSHAQIAKITRAIVTPQLRDVLAAQKADARAKAAMTRLAYAARF